MSDPGLARLELELRQLAGVVGVGLEGGDSGLVVHLLVSDRSFEPDMRRRASDVARRHLDVPVVIEVEGTGQEEAPRVLPGGSRPGRVRLLAVRLADQEVEVHLTWGAARTVGRGEAGQAAGAVAASIEALEGLGAEVPFVVKAVVTVLVGLDQVVVVVLGPREPGGHSAEPMGIARASTLEEAASRATLHALNRFLEVDGVLPAITTPERPSART